MALRKANKLTLKSKKLDVSVALPKRQITKPSTFSVDDIVDDDCMIIDDDSTIKRETFTDRKDTYDVVDEETVDVPADLKELRELLVHPSFEWSVENIKKLPDLPVNYPKKQLPGESTRENNNHNDFDIRELSPLPQSCKFCMMQRLTSKYFSGRKNKHTMNNVPCEFEKTSDYMDSNKFEKVVIPEIESSKGVSVSRKMGADKALGNFIDDSRVHDNTLGRKSNSSQFEKMKRTIYTQNKANELSVKTPIKHLKLNTVLENDVSFQTKIEPLEKFMACSVKQRNELDETKEQEIEGQSNISVCPLCQIQFERGKPQLDIDSHIAQCLSQAGDDVVW